MKKFSFFLMGALAMAFAACEDAPETAPMQQNPQEPVLEGSNVAVTAAGALADPATAVNLETLKSEPVEIFTETALANIPAGATMSYDFYLSKSEDLADAQVLPVTLNGKEGFVSPAEWNDTVKDEYAQQAAHCGHDVLLVNPFCTDPTATDCATGACVHFRNGSIVRELSSGRPGTLLIEL